MEKSDRQGTTRQLDEALSLLSMLEYMVGSLSQQMPASAAIPWTGMMATLRNSRETKELSESLDLLSMLEYLFGTVSQQNPSLVSAPWAGILVTLRNSRDAIRQAQSGDTVSHGQYVPRPNVAERPNYAPKEGTRAAPSLAERVKQVPTTGSRARELLSNANEGSKPSTPSANAAPGSNQGEATEH